jgi:hypothetical protein
MNVTRIRPTPPMTLLALGLFAALPLAAHAGDPVLEWSRIVTETPAGPPALATRTTAMTSLAVHDALNAIHRRYEPYGVIPPAKYGASPDAAVATAARDVLVATIPAQALVVEQKYAAFMAALKPCPYAKPHCIADGIKTGHDAAAAILALRQNDGSDTPDLPYAAPLAVGVYQATPGVPAPRFEGWQFVRPFGIKSKSQFRAGDNAVMHVGSLTYARDYNEVKAKGDALVRGALPNSARSDIARFWPGGGADWHTVARDIAAKRNLDSWQRARLFALLNMAAADTPIAFFDTKYHYRFWRPVTAIRWLHDGNPATKADPDWTPFLATPPYPDYICGLPMGTGTATQVLRRFFHTDYVPYRMTVKAPPVPLPVPFAAPLPEKEITRGFERLSDAEREAIAARVYAGIHFRTGCVVGVQKGRLIGDFIYDHWLRPVSR